MEELLAQYVAAARMYEQFAGRLSGIEDSLDIIARGLEPRTFFGLSEEFWTVAVTAIGTLFLTYIVHRLTLNRERERETKAQSEHKKELARNWFESRYIDGAIEPLREKLLEWHKILSACFIREITPECARSRINLDAFPEKIHRLHVFYGDMIFDDYLTRCFALIKNDLGRDDIWVGGVVQGRLRYSISIGEELLQGLEVAMRKTEFPSIEDALETFDQSFKLKMRQHAELRIDEVSQMVSDKYYVPKHNQQSNAESNLDKED